LKQLVSTFWMLGSHQAALIMCMLLMLQWHSASTRTQRLWKWCHPIYFSFFLSFSIGSISVFTVVEKTIGNRCVSFIGSNMQLTFQKSLQNQIFNTIIDSPCSIFHFSIHPFWTLYLVICHAATKHSCTFWAVT